MSEQRPQFATHENGGLASLFYKLSIVLICLEPREKQDPSKKIYVYTLRVE